MPKSIVFKDARNIYIPCYFVMFLAVMGTHIGIPMKIIGITCVSSQNPEPGDRDPGNRKKALNPDVFLHFRAIQ